MSPALLADLVLLLHASFIVFVVAGAGLVWRWPRLAWVHLPAVAWGIAVELFGWTCPLTPLENQLRQAAGQAGIGSGFIAHYLDAVIYPGWLTRGWQIAFALILAAINLLAYALIARRAWRHRSASRPRARGARQPP